jgi:hypothetical protein
MEFLCYTPSDLDVTVLIYITPTYMKSSMRQYYGFGFKHTYTF